jgi:hypothetical protein
MRTRLGSGISCYECSSRNISDPHCEVKNLAQVFLIIYLKVTENLHLKNNFYLSKHDKTCAVLYENLLYILFY